MTGDFAVQNEDMGWPQGQELLEPVESIAGAGVPYDSCEMEIIVSPQSGDRAEALLRAMGDADWRIRRAAASAIPELDHTLLSIPLYELLASENAGERNAAVKAFVRIGSPAVAYLVPGLDDSDVDVRNFCALALGLIGEHAATAHLIRAMSSEEDHNVQYMIIEALGRLRDPAAIPCIMEALQRSDWIKAPAVDALGAMQCPEAVTALILALNDAYIGGVAAAALGRTGDVRAVLPLAVAAGGASGFAAEMYLSALAEILLSPGQGGLVLARLLRPLLAEEHRMALMGVVGRALGEPRTAPDALVVTEWLDESALLAETIMAMGDVSLHDQGVRLIARQLRLIKCEEVPVLSADAPCHAKQVFLESVAAAGVCRDTGWIVECLADANPLVTAAAARALGTTGDGSHAGHLLPLLDHSLDSVRCAAAEGLASLGADGCAAELLDAVGRGSSERRAAVAHMLAHRGKWSDPSLRQAAQLLVGDPSRDVRIAAARFIPTAPAGMTAALAAALSFDADPVVRRATAEALGRSNLGTVRVYLRGLLDDDDRGVRVAALNGLAAHPDAADSASYVAAMADPDPRVKIAALGGLAALGKSDTTFAIRRALVDTDPDLFCAALRALASADIFEAAAVALGAVYGSDWQVRAVAIDVLRAVRSDLAREPVRRALLDEDSAVRRAAIAASPRVLGAEGISELLLLVADESVGSDAEDALLQVACDAAGRVLERLTEAEGKQRSALLRIAASVCGEDEASLESLLDSSSSEDRFYAALGLSHGSASARWSVKQAARVERDPGVELVMAAIVAAEARSIGTPHA